MKRTSILVGTLLTLAALLVSFGARSSPPASTPSAGASAAPSAGSPPVYLNCTVRAVDLKARTLEVITGVGYALRLYRMKIAPACEVKLEGEASELSKLKPGTIVRVRYEALPAAQNAPAQLIATAIETLPLDSIGSAR